MKGGTGMQTLHRVQTGTLEELASRQSSSTDKGGNNRVPCAVRSTKSKKRKKNLQLNKGQRLFAFEFGYS